MSLVNDSLKFQFAILQIHGYFLLIKCENPLHCIAKDSHIFSTKNSSVFAHVVGIYLTSCGLNDDVKLTKFWTTGPMSFTLKNWALVGDIVKSLTCSNSR